MKKKILILTSSFPTYIESSEGIFVLELAKRLQNEFDVFILAPHIAGSEKVEKNRNLKIYRFQYFWPSKWQKLCYGGGILPNLNKNPLLVFQIPLFLFFELLAVVKVVKEVKIDLIHAHWIIPQGLIAYLNYKIYKTPYILTSHGSDIFTLKGFKFLKKLIVKKAKIITVVSSELRNEILNNIDKSSENKIEVISMGADSKLFSPNKYNKKIKIKYNIQGALLLFVGRLTPEKGVQYLIQALPKVIKLFPKTKLLIIGDGTLRKELESLANKLRVDSHLLFLGTIPHRELPKFYATADIFIGPSLREGFGLTFAEASLCGCASVGTNVGGISDIIQDKKTGLLFKKGDSKDLAGKINFLLENPKIRKEFAIKARKTVEEKFTWKKIAERTINAYSNIL